MSDLQIRSACIEDCSLILSFIKALAEYEKLAHEVIADELALEESLFCEKPFAEVIIAELAGKPVGFALYYYNYSTFLAKPGLYLEDLYVAPDARGNKVGKALLVELARKAVETGCGRFEWWVLDWNQSAIDFYRSLGAVGMEDWTVQRVDGDSLTQLANLKV